jgi:hypothetical protein
MRFLQDRRGMARDEETIAAVKTHMPVIRNNLLRFSAARQCRSDQS